MLHVQANGIFKVFLCFFLIVISIYITWSHNKWWICNFQWVFSKSAEVLKRKKSDEVFTDQGVYIWRYINTHMASCWRCYLGHWASCCNRQWDYRGVESKFSKTKCLLWFSHNRKALWGLSWDTCRKPMMEIIIFNCLYLDLLMPWAWRRRFVALSWLDGSPWLLSARAKHWYIGISSLLSSPYFVWATSNA